MLVVQRLRVRFRQICLGQRDARQALVRETVVQAVILRPAMPATAAMPSHFHTRNMFTPNGSRVDILSRSANYENSKLSRRDASNSEISVDENARRC